MNFRVPEIGEGILLGGSSDSSKIEAQTLLKIVDYLSPMGYKLFAAEQEIKQFIESNKSGVTVELLDFPLDNKQALRTIFQKEDIRGVFNLAVARAKTTDDVDYVMRRNAVDFGVPLFNEPKTVR